MLEYDYGFSFDDPVLEEKKIDESVLSLVEAHKELVTNDVRGKLKEVEQLIIPLLVNLQKNPDKEYIHWPNRVPVIQRQIDKILSITRSYESTK